MITRRAALGLLAGGALSASACSTRSEARKTVRFWGMGRELEVAAGLLRGFEAEHPEIEVEVQVMPVTAAHEKLLTAFAGDALPDLCQLGNTWLAEFAALNALEPLDALASASGAVALPDFFSGVLESNRIGATLYGVPWYVDTRLLFYRRDIVERAGYANPPATWSEWTEMLARVKAEVGKDRFAVLLPLNEAEPLLVLALQQSDSLLREDGRFGNFQSEAFRRALDFYLQMFARGWAPTLTNAEISNVWDEFGKGYFSYYISGPWNIAEFKQRLPPALQEAWMTAPMPGPEGPGVSTAGGSSLVIFRSARHKPEAWTLIEYLSRPAVQQRFYELTGDLPPRRSSWASPTLEQSPHARAFREQLERVRSPPKVPEWERIANEMLLMQERVVRGAVDVDTALRQLDQRTDRILEKRRWMLDHGGYAA